jgi:probable rRNA maturation factor
LSGHKDKIVQAQRAEDLVSRHHGPTRPSTITLRNRQRLRRVDLRLLRQIVRALLKEIWPEAGFDLGIYVVSEAEVTRLNEGFLHHQGSTDVITFDYRENPGGRSRLSGSDIAGRHTGDGPFASPALLHGEIFVCLDEALSQARRFHTIWQSELVRYIVHGLLHLLGHDDRNMGARRKMKRAEDLLVRRLARQFDFGGL